MSKNKSYGQRLWQRSLNAFRNGDRSQARVLLDEALGWAIEHGDSRLWDRAYCSRCSLDIEDGLGAECLAELREIVMRTSCSENAFFAAYNAARAYDLRGDQDRALFYVGIAKDHCGRLARRDWSAWCHNMAGNLLLTKSRIEDACLEYTTARAMLEQDDQLQQAQVLDNLGYCRLLQGRHDEGFGMLFNGLRTLRRIGLEREQAPLELSLCYGYLELGRCRRALQHGLRALGIADKHGDLESTKNSYYLVGETYSQLGDAGSALHYFQLLQRRYFPATPHIPEFLLAVDVRSLINLKAV